jgi:hypothetical protein
LAIRVALLEAELVAAGVAAQVVCDERDAWKKRAFTAEASSGGAKVAKLEEALRDAIAEALAIRKQRDVWKQERDTWRDRARAAETSSVVQEPPDRQVGGPDRRFRQLRALLASEFHPDHSKTDGIERIIRGEIFKTLWPKVQDIEKSAAGS